MNQTRILCLVFVIGYVFFLNFNLVSDLGYDEARHSAQGHFFYDYGSSLLDGEWQSPKAFLRVYALQHYPIGWYALYDPPVHAISQAFVFLALGSSTFAARLATMLWVLLGSWLLFLLARAVFKDEWWAVCTVMLFFLTPFTYYFSRQAMLTIPISLMIAGWYYSSFYSKHQYRYVWSTLCLIAAGMMKYQTMIFFAVFAVVYTLIVFFQSKKKNIISLIKKTPILSLIIQSIGFLIVFFPWYWVSLKTTNIAGRLFQAGTQEVKGGAVGSLSYFFSFFIQAVTKTYGIVLLGLLPVIFYKKNTFLKTHWPMALYVLTTFVTATFLISNKQFRYIVHVLPFLIIFSVEGLRMVYSWLSKYSLLSTSSIKRSGIVVVLLLFMGLAAADISEAYRTTSEWGEKQDDVYSWISDQSLPRIVVNVDLKHNQTDHTSNFYHSPDLFIFRMMSLNAEHNPVHMRQAITRMDLDRPEKIHHLISFFDLTKDTHTQIVVMHKRPYLSAEGRVATRYLTHAEFSFLEFDEYVVFYRQAPPSKLVKQIFPELGQRTSAHKHIEKGRAAFKNGDFALAEEEFKTSYRRDPLRFDVIQNLGKTMRIRARDELGKGNQIESITLYQEAFDIDPTNDKIRTELIALYEQLAAHSESINKPESAQKFKLKIQEIQSTLPLVLMTTAEG